MGLSTAEWVLSSVAVRQLIMSTPWCALSY